MEKKYKATYEEIGKIDEKHYLDLHKMFSERGDSIPNGSVVKPTDWAIENGVIRKGDNNIYIKVRNARTENTIYVKKEGNTQGGYYWSGFWELTK